MAEAYGKTYQMPVLILRLPPVYSARMGCDDGYIAWAMRQIRNGKSIHCPFPSDAWMDVVEGEGLACSIYALVKNGCTGMYRILSGHPFRFDTFYQILSSVVGKRADISYDPDGMYIPQEWYCADRRHKDETGWMPFHLLQEDTGFQILKAANENTEQKRKEKKHCSRNLKVYRTDMSEQP